MFYFSFAVRKFMGMQGLLQKAGLWTIMLSFSFLSCSTMARPHDNPETVPYVDLDRYLGTWYEIASFPQRFSRNCVASKAEYSLREDGRIRVINSCREKTFDGEKRSVDGVAWVVDSETNAKLKVQFQWPFRGDYWVVGLDPDYQWAVVSGPGRRSLWILSRTRQMDSELLNLILSELEADGFDLSRLEMTPQPES